MGVWWVFFEFWFFYGGGWRLRLRVYGKREEGYIYICGKLLRWGKYYEVKYVRREGREQVQVGNDLVYQKKKTKKWGTTWIVGLSVKKKLELEIVGPRIRERRLWGELSRWSQESEKRRVGWRSWLRRNLHGGLSFKCASTTSQRVRERFRHKFLLLKCLCFLFAINFLRFIRFDSWKLRGTWKIKIVMWILLYY